ncbi:MAG: YraN family protein, partial [Acidobacteria bacterium]|nr:YraN family protein [Acidobacteriota bacterium]
VATCGALLVVCEVKARASGSHGSPAEAVGRQKQIRVRRTAAEFLAALRGTDPVLASRIRDVRFDVAAVLGSSIEVLEDAF